ncbi:pentatricopeptide repeat-containing protein At2g17525, mitochondrial [Tripterygium wilfordii]|uniref:pentatricopeptide repeat-containing protein At2g17525, mitochondrial n=1 Tax=Tripterygium wilfordii TaxID=458696 RepID=UPI0018F7F113|nr:pentatricopeptide repeat-containing protein At2g17525, mitochondrial [Tripterygium wilfordii]
MPRILFPSKVAILSKLPLVFQSKPISSSSLGTSLSAPTHEHIAHLILEQKTPSQALHTFRWASTLPNFTHSHSTYRALIHRLCSFRRFETVQQLLDEMPHSINSPPDEDIFVTLIRGLGRAGRIRLVVNVPDLFRKFNQAPSLKMFNSILDVLVKEDINLAREFYQKKMMRSGVQGDDYTFGILMKGLCFTNRIGDGFKLLQVMKSRGLRPNTVIYNTLIHALCKNGKVGRARSLMNEVEEPNDVTFNILVSGYCREQDLVQALVLMEKSFSLGFVPDVVTVTKVVELLCNVGRVMEAVEILERMESKGGVVDVVAYNTLIKGLCRTGKVKAGHGFLKVMESKGCLPTVDTYNMLISGFCESGMLNLALDLFNEMKTDGIIWNFDTCDMLIRGLCSEGRMEDGFKILELMEETKAGSRGHSSPYNSVLYGFYKNNDRDQAVEFLKKMGKLFPKAVDRSLQILSFCEKGCIEDAKRVYDQMTEEGQIPSVIVYDSLILGFCLEGCVREAFELMNKMVDIGKFPVASTVNAIISGFLRQGKLSSALKLLEDMVGRGCLPSIESYRPLVEALCGKGDFQRALGLFLQMVGKGTIPDNLMWNSLLLCLCQETKRLQTKNMFSVNNNLLQSIIET